MARHDFTSALSRSPPRRRTGTCQEGRTKRMSRPVSLAGYAVGGDEPRAGLARWFRSRGDEPRGTLAYAVPSGPHVFAWTSVGVRPLCGRSTPVHPRVPPPATALAWPEETSAEAQRGVRKGGLATPARPSGRRARVTGVSRRGGGTCHPALRPACSSHRRLAARGGDLPRRPGPPAGVLESPASRGAGGDLPRRPGPPAGVLESPASRGAGGDLPRRPGPPAGVLESPGDAEGATRRPKRAPSSCDGEARSGGGTCHAGPALRPACSSHPVTPKAPPGALKGRRLSCDERSEECERGDSNPHRIAPAGT